MLKGILIFVAILGCALGEEEEEKAICSPWFDAINGLCYYFSAAGEETSWHGARDQCSVYGGEFAVFGRSCGEDAILLRAIADKGVAEVWVGASDLAEAGSWRWTDGRAVDDTFLAWFPENPVDTLYANCAHLGKTAAPVRMYMHNTVCQNAYAYICEIQP